MMKLDPILRFGSGCGIEIRGDDLRLVGVKSRASGVAVLGTKTVSDFRRRDPAEWGPEIASFLADCGLSHVAVTVALPRREVVVRQIHLPALGQRELAAAVRYQLDGLHPYGDEEVDHSFAVVGAADDKAASRAVVVVIAEAARVEDYARAFEQAGVAVAGFTVGFAALHTALRVRWEQLPLPLLAAERRDSRLAVFGESAGRPVLSAEFDLETVTAQRALQMALADLRLSDGEPAAVVTAGEAAEELDQWVPVGCELRATAELFPAPLAAADFDLREDLAALATAIEAACPRLGWRLNLLPVARRKSDSRWMWVPTAALAAALALLAIGFVARPLLQNGAYAAALEQRLSQLGTVVSASDQARSEAGGLRQKLAILQSLEGRTERDLAVVSEISLLLPDTVWLRALELDDSGVRLTGDAESSAPLLGILNESKTVEKASFLSSIRKTEEGERFQIGAQRRARIDPALVRTIPPPAPAAAQGDQPQSESDAAGAALQTLGESEEEAAQ